MKVAIFGATGRTVRHLVNQAFLRKIEVIAFVRNRTKVEWNNELFNVVEGDVLDKDLVCKVIEGCNGVVSALGQVKGSPPNIQTRAIETIIDAMNEHEVRRLVSLTGADVWMPGDRPTLLNRTTHTLLKLVAPARLHDGEEHARRIIVQLYFS